MSHPFNSVSAFAQQETAVDLIANEKLHLALLPPFPFTLPRHVRALHTTCDEGLPALKDIWVREVPPSTRTSWNYPCDSTAWRPDRSRVTSYFHCWLSCTDTDSNRGKWLALAVTHKNLWPVSVGLCQTFHWKSERSCVFQKKCSAGPRT